MEIIIMLISLAAMLGGNKLVTYLEELKRDRKGLTPGMFMKVIDEIISMARAKGATALEKVQRALNSIMNSTYTTNSSALTPYLQKAYDKVQQVYDKVSDIQTKASSFDQSAAELTNAYENLSNSAKKMNTGRFLKGSAETAANNAANYYKWATEVKDNNDPNIPGPGVKTYTMDDAKKDRKNEVEKTLSDMADSYFSNGGINGNV